MNQPNRRRIIDGRPEQTAMETGLLQQIEKLEKERDALRNVCEEVLEHLQGEEDIRDGSDGTPMPNDAMSLCTQLRDVLGHG